MAGAILCPFCKNGTIDWADLRIDLVANVAVCNAGIVRLAPEQAVLVHALAKNVPHAVAYERLITALWGSLGAPENARRLIYVIKVKANKQLKTIGYTIEAMWGFGYRLTRAV